MVIATPKPHTENISNQLQGIHKIAVDGKKRIHIPTIWQDILKSGKNIQFMNAGGYLILITDYRVDDPDIIVVSHEISHDGRLLLGGKLSSAFNIEIGNEVGLIGKGNHIELYLDMNKFNNALQRSQDAVRNFQARLLGVL